MFKVVEQQLIEKLINNGHNKIKVIAKKSIKNTAHSHMTLQGKQYSLELIQGDFGKYAYIFVESGKRELFTVHGEGLILRSIFEEAFLWYDESISEKYYVVVDFSLNPKEDFVSFQEEWKREKVGQKLKVLRKQWNENNTVIAVFECRGSEDLKILQGIAERMYWSGVTTKHDTDIQIDVDLAEYDFFNR